MLLPSCWLLRGLQELTLAREQLLWRVHSVWPNRHFNFPNSALNSFRGIISVPCAVWWDIRPGEWMLVKKPAWMRLQGPFPMLDARLVLPSSGGEREMAAGTRAPAEGGESQMNLLSRRPRGHGRLGRDPEYPIGTSELRVLYEEGEC